MSIPSNILELINRLNQELAQTEQISLEGLRLVRLPLSQFPTNVILVQFFAYFNNVLFFIEHYRQRIQNILNVFFEAASNTSRDRI